MKKLLQATILFCCILSKSFAKGIPIDSLTKGIKFERGLSWKQIIAKARKEGKYIFVDCYTTWCGPCKRMEKEVYPNSRVGDFYNRKFISVKIQMDTGLNDNADTKASYADARIIERKYKINAYPSLLFFMPDGRVLHKEEGARDPDQFLELAREVTDSSKNYYLLLEDYKDGKRELSQMRYLARMSMLLANDSAQSVAIRKEYGLKLGKEDLLTKDNIEFMHDFTQNSEDFGFEILLRHSDSINKMMNDNNYCQEIIQRIIHQEIISPSLRMGEKEHSTPNWDSLAWEIKNKYDEYYAERVIIASRSSWGYIVKNWPEYTKYLVLFAEKYSVLNGHSTIQETVLNSYAWAIFLYSNDKEELNIALSWSSRAVMISPIAYIIDTYANLLYKLNRQKEAVQWEEVAVKVNPDNVDIQKNLEQMKKGEPTWAL